MRIAVTGASGLIGSALVPSLRAQGHQVQRLVRRPAAAADEVTWDPAAGTVDLDALAGVEGVVHLAGVGVSDKRWSDSFKGAVLSSRVEGTNTIATAMAALSPVPAVLVSASAIGFYGDRDDEILDEDSHAGTGFLADVVLQWEASTEPAEAAGIRVAHIRTGLVVSGKGGAFGQLLPLIKLGVGGRLGSGKQWWSWISLTDEIRAIEFLLTHEVSGAVNLTGPTPLTNGDATRLIGQTLHRPTLLAVPGFALKLVLGEFAGNILGGQRVLPKRLQQAGFTFTHSTLDAAIAAVT